jgi:hypothetical protein
MTFDFLSSFISSYFTFLQQKKVYEVFDYVFNQKLKLFSDSEKKFGKNNYNLLNTHFTKNIACILEDLFINSITNNSKKLESNKKKLVNEIRNGNY